MFRAANPMSLINPGKIIRLNQSNGFSLIEMAIVLLILGLLLSGLLITIANSTSNGRRSMTEMQLEQIEEALYGYAQAYGRLPCPATGASNGRASPEDGTACNVSHGFLPAVTLGLSGSMNNDSLLLDAWQNPYRYSVSTLAVAGNNAFTNATGLTNLFADMTQLTAANMLRVCDISDCSGDIYTNLAPAVVISMGPNWATFTSNNEIKNAGEAVLDGYPVTNTSDFVSADYNEQSFDDQVVWLSPHVLITRLIRAGRLP